MTDERFKTRGLCPRCNEPMCDIDLEDDYDEKFRKVQRYYCDKCRKRWDKADLLPENRPKLTRAQREALAWLHITGRHRKGTHSDTRWALYDVIEALGYSGDGNKVTEEIRGHYKLGNLPLMQAHMSLVAVGFELFETSKWLTYFRQADYACITVHKGGRATDDRFKRLFDGKEWTERGMALLTEAKRKPRPSPEAVNWLEKAYREVRRSKYNRGLCLVRGNHETPAVLELVELGLAHINSRELRVDPEPTMYHELRLTDGGHILASKALDERVEQILAERRTEKGS